MQSRADWGFKAANVSSDALHALQFRYGMFPGLDVARLEFEGYAQQCCDRLWMPPIRFVNADALCDINYRLIIAECGGADYDDDTPLTDEKVTGRLSQDDAPIIQKHCDAQNLPGRAFVLGWAVHWEGVMSMRV